MNIEYEATFANIDKEVLRVKLRAVGGTLVRSEYMQKRAVFYLPPSMGIDGSTGYGRVRDEGDKITMAIKIFNGDKITDQLESELTINSFEGGVQFMQTIGCKEKAYQETKRELWEFDSVEVMIDEWPFLNPFVEIEGSSEEAVKHVSEKLGFTWSDAHFGAVGIFYERQYGGDVTADTLNNHTPRLTFDMANPFL